MWLDSKAVNCPQKWGNFPFAVTTTTCCTTETCGSAEYFDLTRFQVSGLSTLAACAQAS